MTKTRQAMRSAPPTSTQHQSGTSTDPPVADTSNNDQERYSEINFQTKICNKMHIIWFLGGLLRWVLKPPYSMACENFESAIWNTSHWNFVKFGLKTPYNIF